MIICIFAEENELIYCDMNQKHAFQEVNENYTMAEAIQEAQRCLHCKVPQCQKGCPISNDIPDWVHELSKGNLGNAISIIRAKSNLPAVCGRVCAHEKQCEGSCVLGKKGQALNIGKLERFVADFDSDNELTHEDIVEKKRGRVAVIGAGPSGITVAGDLSRMGFSVEIFEMEAQCGGVLRYGIPEYRLPKEVVAREIRYIEKMGVVIHRNTHVGFDITIDSLFGQGFDFGQRRPRAVIIVIRGKIIGLRIKTRAVKHGFRHRKAAVITQHLVKLFHFIYAKPVQCGGIKRSFNDRFYGFQR